MKDYHVYSMDDVMNGKITDHGVVLSTGDIPWAGRQLWDCDVAFKEGKYYMYCLLYTSYSRTNYVTGFADQYGKRRKELFLPEFRGEK